MDYYRALLESYSLLKKRKLKLLVEQDAPKNSNIPDYQNQDVIRHADQELKNAKAVKIPNPQDPEKPKSASSQNPYKTKSLGGTPLAIFTTTKAKGVFLVSTIDKAGMGVPSHSKTEGTPEFIGMFGYGNSDGDGTSNKPKQGVDQKPPPKVSKAQTATETSVEQSSIEAGGTKKEVERISKLKSSIQSRVDKLRKKLISLGVSEEEIEKVVEFFTTEKRTAGQGGIGSFISRLTRKQKSVIEVDGEYIVSDKETFILDSNQMVEALEIMDTLLKAFEGEEELQDAEKKLLSDYLAKNAIEHPECDETDERKKWKEVKNKWAAEKTKELFSNPDNSNVQAEYEAWLEETGRKDKPIQKINYFYDLDKNKNGKKEWNKFLSETPEPACADSIVLTLGGQSFVMKDVKLSGMNGLMTRIINDINDRFKSSLIKTKEILSSGLDTLNGEYAGKLNEYFYYHALLINGRVRAMQAGMSTAYYDKKLQELASNQQYQRYLRKINSINSLYLAQFNDALISGNDYAMSIAFTKIIRDPRIIDSLIAINDRVSKYNPIAGFIAAEEVGAGKRADFVELYGPGRNEADLPTGVIAKRFSELGVNERKHLNELAEAGLLPPDYQNGVYHMRRVSLKVSLSRTDSDNLNGAEEEVYDRFTAGSIVPNSVMGTLAGQESYMDKSVMKDRSDLIKLVETSLGKSVSEEQIKKFQQEADEAIKLLDELNSIPQSVKDTSTKRIIDTRKGIVDILEKNTEVAKALGIAIPVPKTLTHKQLKEKVRNFSVLIRANIDASFKGDGGKWEPKEEEGAKARYYLATTLVGAAGVTDEGARTIMRSVFSDSMDEYDFNQNEILQPFFDAISGREGTPKFEIIKSANGYTFKTADGKTTGGTLSYDATSGKWRFDFRKSYIESLVESGVVSKSKTKFKNTVGREERRNVISKARTKKRKAKKDQKNKAKSKKIK